MNYYLNKEIFLIAEDEMITAELTVHDEMAGVIERMQLLNPIDNIDTKLYHGVLTSAEVLPSSTRGKKCFILVINLDSGDEGGLLEGCVFESDCEDNVEVLAGEIEHIVRDNEYVTFPINIGNMFVLYGYALEVTLGVADDEIDEEIIDTCTKIAEEVKQIRQEIDLGDNS